MTKLDVTRNAPAWAPLFAYAALAALVTLIGE